MLGEQHLVEAVMKAEERIKSSTPDTVYQGQMMDGVKILEEELFKVYNRLMDE